VLSHNHWDHVGGLMTLRRELAKTNPRAMSRVHVGAGIFVTAQGRVEDNVPEDSALVFDSKEEIVILTGCGHAGIINIAEYARSIAGDKPLLAMVGGLHLFNATDQALAWTGAKLKSYRLENLLAGHCTGIKATYRLRESTGLSRKTAVVSAAGSSFTLGLGIDARLLTH